MRRFCRGYNSAGILEIRLLNIVINPAEVTVIQVWNPRRIKGCICIVPGSLESRLCTVRLPENPADPSNIEGIGMLIFTQYVVPFEVLSIVLLASLIGAIYMAKGEGNR